MKPVTLLFVVVLVLAAVTGGVQAQADGGNLTNETANETDTGERLTNETENESTPAPAPTPEPASTPPEEAESDDENVSTTPPTVSRTIAPTMRVVGEEWTEDGLLLVVDSDLPDTFQITERYGDDRFRWETYRLRPGENRVYYQFEVSRQDELSIASVGAKQGIIINPPTAAVWKQPAKWADHYLTWIATGSGFLAVLVYRFRKRKFWEERRFFSLLDKRVVGEMDASEIVGKNEKPETRWGRFKSGIRVLVERFKRVFYSTRGVLSLVVAVLLAEIATGGALSRHFLNLQTEYQLLLLVFAGSLFGWYWPAGKFLDRVYTPDLRSMLVVDPIDGGEVDVVQGGRERFRNLTINGADSLKHKDTPGGGEVLLARSYDAAEHAVTATWHKLKDEVEILASNKAIRANTWALANKLDEAREIISSQVALRLSYQDEADKIAMEKLDEVKLPDHRTTSETIAEDVDAWTHRGRDDTAAEDVDYVGEDGEEDASNESEGGSEQAANDGADNGGEE
jgi:hypothetical protein